MSKLNLQCEKCLSIFTTAYNLKRHKEKPTPCVKPEDRYRCLDCFNKFQNSSNLKRHRRTCPFLNKNDEKENDIVSMEIDTLRQRLEALETKNNSHNNSHINTDNNSNSNQISGSHNSSVMTTNNSSHNNTTNINSHNPITININAFSPNTEPTFPFEDEDKRIAEDLRFHSKLFSLGSDGVIELLKYIHFNENNPEEHNIYISNTKHNEIIIYNGKMWILQSRNDILKDLLNEQNGYLTGKYEEFKKYLGKIPKKNFENYLEKKDNIEIKEHLLTQLKQLFYNNRGMIEATRKKQLS